MPLNLPKSCFPTFQIYFPYIHYLRDSIFMLDHFCLLEIIFTSLLVISLSFSLIHYDYVKSSLIHPYLFYSPLFFNLDNIFLMKLFISIFVSLSL